MAKLTKTEKRAYDALLAAPDQTLGVEALVEQVYGAHKPVASKSGMAAIMRMLIAKTEGWSVKAVRVSALGRGNKGVYALQKGSE